MFSYCGRKRSQATILREILSICLQNLISQRTIERFRGLVKDHNKLYLSLYGFLKPKFHFFLHYPRIMEIVGPVRHIWSIRFEGKHRVLKKGMAVSANHLNVPNTTAFKHQLNQCKLFFNQNDSEYHINYKKLQSSTTLISLVGYIENYNSYDQIQSITILNSEYRKNSALKIVNTEKPTFGVIESMVMV